MVLCKPESVGGSERWENIRADKQLHLLLQKYDSLKVPWIYNFRIILRYTKDYQVAVSDDIDEILRDWENIQTLSILKLVNAQQPSSTSTNQLPNNASQIQTVLTLLKTNYKEKRKSRKYDDIDSLNIVRVHPQQPNGASPSYMQQPHAQAMNGSGTSVATIATPDVRVSPPEKQNTARNNSNKRSRMDFEECIKWEKKRDALSQKVEGLVAKKRAHLQGVINDYLEGLRTILWDESGGWDDSMKQRMLSKEYERVVLIGDMLNSSKCAAIKLVDDTIATMEKASMAKTSVIKAQARIRGYLTRKKYKPLLRNQKHRNKCVRELVETERTYVRLLGVMVTAFVIPLRNSSLIPKQDLTLLFSNIEVVLSVNRELLKQLEERLAEWGPQSLIGDVFVTMAPFLKIYIEYINKYSTSLSVTNRYAKIPEFQDFMKKCKNTPEAKGMDLTSFQILPVQRVPRYELLLKEIVKATPATHPDYQNLQKAAEVIQEVAKTINESKRLAENTSKVMEIQQLLDFNSGDKFELKLEELSKEYPFSQHVSKHSQSLTQTQKQHTRENGFEIPGNFWARKLIEQDYPPSLS